MSSACALASGAAEEVRKVSGTAQSRVRVLTLTPFFPSIEDPAQGAFIAEPLAAMKALGISTAVIAAQPFYRAPAHSADSSMRWKRYFSVPGNPGLPLAGTFLAAQLARAIVRKHHQTPFDVIHAHAALPCGHAAAAIAERLSIPFVVSVHGLDAFFTKQAGAVFGSWCRRVAERVYRSASAVICISEKVRQQVCSETRTNTTVVYNGVDVEKFFPETEQSSRLNILSVGNLIATKGHVLLIRAFARLLSSFPDCVLEVIGNGPERERLGKLTAELGIAGSVRFHGRRGRDYVAEAMRRCSIFVLPSSYEGLGCVYLEAMACAKVAIGCRGQGIEEVIEHGESGMLVAPDNESELTDAMGTLLREKELRQRIGKNARMVILDRLTLGHQAQQLVEVYRRCAR